MRFVTRHGILSGMASVVGRNVLFWCIRYGFIVDEVLRGACPPQCIKVNYFKGIDEGTCRLACFVSEVSAIRDDRSIFCPDFSKNEMNDIIRYLRTSQCLIFVGLTSLSCRSYVCTWRCVVTLGFNHRLYFFFPFLFDCMNA